MPAETHQLSEQTDSQAILDLVAALVGVDPDDAPELSLVAVDLHDDLAILHLWASVVEEFGERSVGDIELDDPRPATLADLATLFHESL
jgi:hypothetical protein